MLSDSGLETAEELQHYIRNGMIEIVMKSLIVFPVRGTKLVNITYSSTDPRLAADIASMFAETYIESHLKAKLEITQKASNWLCRILDKEQLVDTGDSASINVVELERLTESLVEATQEKNDARALFLQVSKNKSSIERALSAPSLANNSTLQSLVEAKSDAARLVTELSERCKSKHPKMVTAILDIEHLDAELKVQIELIAEGLKVNYQTKQNKTKQNKTKQNKTKQNKKNTERAIKFQMSEVKERLQNVSRKEFTLHELEREVDANRQVYEVFLNRGKEINEKLNLQAMNAWVINIALPAEYSVKLKKTKIVIMAVLASGMFAVGIILLLDWLDNTIKTSEDVEEKLQVPLLGHLPLDKTNKDDAPFLGFLSDDSWHCAEAIRTIRTSFILSGLDKPAKVTVVTSSVPNEGKSTVSICIAHALAQMEKVLLIDADMCKPSVDECITQMPKFEVHLLTAGVVLGNPLDLIAGDRFLAVLDMLKEKYDRIIIDSAPIQAVSDSIVIAAHADALIYVVKSDGFSTPLIKKGLRRLSEANACFSCVVLNQVDISKVKKQSGYENSYYDNYGYAYGDTSDSDDKV